jgi:hypothetical protein
MPAPAAVCWRPVLATLVLMAGACTTPPAAQDPRPTPMAEPVRHESADISIRLVGILRAGDRGTLVKDPGWHEYILAIENTGKRTLRVHNVKLLNRNGRYYDSASSYEQIVVPPDTASEIAGTVATRAAGAAAGQVIPYGGTIVGILSGAISTSASEAAANARRELEQRKLKDVELAAAGKVTGSAFLPRVPDAKTLVLDYGHGADTERIELALPHRRG